MHPQKEPLRAEVLQERLRRALDARLNASGAPGSPAVAVLRSCDLPRFAQSVLDFTAMLPLDTARSWRADFTRTVFLAGNPRNLATRLTPSFTTAEGEIAWYAPGAGTRHRELRLLLRLVRGALTAGPPPPYALRAPHRGPATGRHWRLTVATWGLTLPDYLVHLNHTLAESWLTGVLGPGDRIAVVHVPYLDELPARPAYLRVHQDTAVPGQLRAYACLTAAEESGND